MEPQQNEPPWSITIRDPGPDVPHRAATWADRLPVLPMAASAVALFVVVVAALVALDGGSATSGPEVLSNAVGTPTTVRPAPSPESTPSASSTTPTTSTTSTSSTTAPTTTSKASVGSSAPAATVDPEPAGLPIHTPGDLGNGWVAQVSSVPASAGGSALSRSYDTISRTVPDAIIVRGSEWASLRAGFWVIVRAGHGDATSAVEDCDRWGLGGRDECFARHLSSADSTQRICWRDESGALAGDCT